ncbi:MAG: HlyD family efflux transporter periplasmic adaptor subunit [Desulfobacterium sp.]|nr:HlyD family efflux transporter periplasmic adaptor subunit [Desulfobacterium sp.]
MDREDLVAALFYAFWPQPTMVDIGLVEHGPMMATMEPSPPNPLDLRDKAQAISRVSAAKATLGLAGAEYDRAVADRELADIVLRRRQNLIKSDLVSKSELDHALREARTSSAALRNAKAAILVREAELEGARAQLINFEDNRSKDGKPVPRTPVLAPATGRVLRIMHQSEAVLPAGTAIMEIGNIENDLEVIVELLSLDAVRISVGDKAILTDWGGPGILNGKVMRIDPWGFTKFSALGVEEQRVNALIQFTDPDDTLPDTLPNTQPDTSKKAAKEALNRLGHGFRIQTQIVVWEDKNALIVPSSALFRKGRDWTVFQVIDHIATLCQIKIGQNNGVKAQVIHGLKPGDKVILYPPSGLTNGDKVSKRIIKY